jgi:arsenite-transporting ATPase
MKEDRFKAALAALSNPSLTRIVLVTRPDRAALAEAARTSRELAALGLSNQHLVVNGVFTLSLAGDAVARSVAAQGDAAVSDMPEVLAPLPRDDVPLRSFDMVGLPALRGVLTGVAPQALTPKAVYRTDLPPLNSLVDTLAAAQRGLIMVMGKGGVGKTTVAAAVALGLCDRGHSVHLSTTDPAAHLDAALDAEVQGLRVDRIDPRAETERYIEKIMASNGRGLDAAGRDLLLEDLRSPCTEEVAVFHAFSRVVAEARSSFVVLDTAPTGHTLLLMDATGAYHRQMKRDLAASGAGRVVTPLMRLQDPDWTKIILVTLPETTPVSEAAALQEDLRRAQVEPFAWVINRSLAATGSCDPLLAARMNIEAAQVARVTGQLARRTYAAAWMAEPPVGPERLRAFAGSPVTAGRET